MTPDTMKAWRARLSLGEAGMAAYLGVPVTTYRKWENGTRKPDAAPLRLFDLLRSIESLDDGGVFHRDLIREATEAEIKPTKARKPRAATMAPPTPEKCPSGPDSGIVAPFPWVHAAQALPGSDVIEYPCAAFNGGDCGCASQGDCKLTAAPPAAWALPDWMKGVPDA